MIYVYVKYENLKIQTKKSSPPSIPKSMVEPIGTYLAQSGVPCSSPGRSYMACGTANANSERYRRRKNDKRTTAHLSPTPRARLT